MKERPTYLSIELLTPNNLGTGVDSLEILCHLRTLGYNKFFVSDQSKNKSVTCPQPALEGQYINYSFDGTCSGLFGKELKGPWLPIDKIAMEYLDYFHGTANTASNKLSLLERVIRKFSPKKPQGLFHANGWFDVHAKMG